MGLPRFSAADITLSEVEERELHLFFSLSWLIIVSPVTAAISGRTSRGIPVDNGNLTAAVLLGFFTPPVIDLTQMLLSRTKRDKMHVELDFYYFCFPAVSVPCNVAATREHCKSSLAALCNKSTSKEALLLTILQITAPKINCRKLEHEGFERNKLITQS